MPTYSQGDTSGAGRMPSDGRVERQPDGGMRLSWEHAAKGMTSARALLLDSHHLPVRIEIAAEGTPEEGDLQGIRLEYSTTIEYEYEQVASFSDSDFVLDVPADAYREGVTYELSLERPWSEQAEWGQYWLGEAVGDWKLTRAEYALHEDSPDLGSGAEPRDEGVFLIYERPDKTSPNENIQMIVRAARGPLLRGCAQVRRTARGLRRLGAPREDPGRSARHPLFGVARRVAPTAISIPSMSSCRMPS